MALIDYIIVVIFLAAIFWVGSSFYKWIVNPDDFYVAGRKLTPFILAATLTATNISLYSFIGVSGTAYKHGISIIWQTWTGNMALVLAGLFILPIMRRLRIRTIPELLELRYNGAVRLLVSLLWIFRLAFWLGVVLYAGVSAAQQITGIESFTFWALLFSAIIIIYTMVGGMWSIVFTDAIQFILMMIAVLVVLPIAMNAVDWWPGLISKVQAGHLDLITQTGKYNWKFVIAIWFLGIQWACLDQGLLQRTFSARNTKVVVKGMVWSGIITTPFAFLWVTPGLAASVLYPGLDKPEFAVPMIIIKLVPTIILGIIICGLLASQMSTIDSNLGSAATLFTNDIYKRFLKRKATTKEILRVIRITTIVTGVIMIAVSYLVPYLGGTVDAYLTIISIMDMPLFVIAIVYGLFWKRASWQGAIAGYLGGAFVGAVLKFAFDVDVSTVTFASGAVALLILPLVSFLTPLKNSESINRIFEAKKSTAEASESTDIFNIIPLTRKGQLSLIILFSGLFIFFCGVIMGSQNIDFASHIAVSGMIVFFTGGWLRTRFS
jgi:solute:Na+ symporter, SSS family